MTIEKAKQIRIVDYLASMGVLAVKVKGISYWYLSPLRGEHTPSFKVNDYTNEWYDFGTAQGGDIIDLCKLLFNLSSVSEALERLGDVKDVSSMRIREHTELYDSIRQKMRDVKILPLRDVVLLSYLETRGIDQQIGKMYCREIHYTYYRNKYSAIAFPNRSNGYEIRNSYFKGCVYNKDISLLHHIPGGQQTSCCVFEGFMDFLSYLTIKQNDKRSVIPIDAPCDYLVLNSVNNLRKGMSVLADYSTIHCFLDNDTAGQNAVASIKNVFEMSAVDDSFRYAGHKDLNDYLMGKKM